MLVTQEPTLNSLYFQKNIPDIILTKNGDDTLVTFELKKGNDVILLEKYVYDTSNTLRIRNLGDVLEKYLNAQNLLLSFSYTITEGVSTHTSAFNVLKCDADMSVDANVWTQLNFLTRSYLEKRTSKNRNEYLSFLQKTSFGAVTKHFNVYYLLNGVVTQLAGTLGNIAASASDQVTTFNASMGALVTAAELAPSTDILQYEIWLTGTNFETGKTTFLVDTTPYRDAKYFVFTNCFGVLETFTATGKVETKKTAEYNLANIDNHYRKITQDFVAEKTANSGYLSSSEMDWTDDLLRSYDISTYKPGSTGSDEEITITSIEKTDTEANELQSFQFSYRHAKNNHLEFTNAAKGIFDDTFDETYD